MDGHAAYLGGVIVDHGQFDWLAHADKFPGLTTPDESYHGVTYAEKFGREGAFITKATAQLMRDLGPMQNPQAAFFLNSSLESLHVRMPRHCENGLAVAKFLQSQAPGCSAYVIGDHGLYNALYDAGITIDDVSPDYVVVGETTTYGYEHILRAMNLVNKGAKLIATNTDITGPIEGGIAPACRAFVAPIEATTGKQAYYVGKPNPLMMRTGLRILGVHSNEAVMIGDRMDTDVIAGIETGLDTVLVLSGVSTRETVDKFPYRPRLILNGVGDIPTLEK